MKAHRIAALLALGIAGWSCKTASVSVKGNAAKGVDFSKFKTIASGGQANLLPKGFQREDLPEDLAAIAREEAIRVFGEKGYEVIDDPDSADLLVVGTLGLRDEVVQQVTTGVDSGMHSGSLPDMEVTRGMIVLEALTRDGGQRVWLGTLDAVLQNEPDPVKRKQNFRREIGRLFETFPNRIKE